MFRHDIHTPTYTHMRTHAYAHARTPTHMQAPHTQQILQRKTLMYELYNDTT